MALTATASQGFEFDRCTAYEEVVWMPGDPGVTYTQGNLVSYNTTAGSAGVMILGTDSLADVFGRVEKTVVCPANTQAFPVIGNELLDDDSAASKCLVKVRAWIPEGTPIYRCTFKNHVDDTVVSYSASSRYVEAAAGNGADDRPNGALIFVYAGPGAGEINVVEDYDHTGGAVELLVQLHRPFNATLTSSSKYICLSGEATANAGIGLGSRIDAADEDELDCADGSNDGDYVVYGDWRTIGNYLKKLMLPVIRRNVIYSA